MKWLLRRRENQHGLSLLHPWPVERPADWVDFANETQAGEELLAIRESVSRGCPFGSDQWAAETVSALGLESTLRDRGRPRSDNNGGT